jgi:hypothetical protein
MKTNADWNISGDMGVEFKNGIFELRYCKRGEKPNKDTPAPILWKAAVRVAMNKASYTSAEVAEVLERFSNSALAVQARKLGKGVHVFESVNDLCTFFQRAEGETRKQRALEKAQEDWRNKRNAFAESVQFLDNDSLQKVMENYDTNNPMPE